MTVRQRVAVGGGILLIVIAVTLRVSVDGALVQIPVVVISVCGLAVVLLAGVPTRAASMNAGVSRRTGQMHRTGIPSDDQAESPQLAGDVERTDDILNNGLAERSSLQRRLLLAAIVQLTCTMALTGLTIYCLVLEMSLWWLGLPLVLLGLFLAAVSLYRRHTMGAR